MYQISKNLLKNVYLNIRYRKLIKALNLFDDLRREYKSGREHHGLPSSCVVEHDVGILLDGVNFYLATHLDRIRDSEVLRWISDVYELRIGSTDL